MTIELNGYYTLILATLVLLLGRDAIINPDFALKIAAGRENELADSLDGPLGAQAQHIPDVLWGLLLNMQPWVPFRGLK